MGHARALLSLPVADQLDLANKAVRNGWSVRETERRSQNLLAGKKPEAPKQIDPDLRRLNETLTQSLGVVAEVKSRNRKKGTLVLHFDSADTFAALMERLGVELDA